MADEYSYTKIIADSVKSQLPNSSHSHDYSDSSIHSRACFVTPSQTTTHYKYGFGHEYECGDRSRLLVVLRWCSGILDKIVSAYLANPFLMVFLPFLIGMVLGGILVCYVLDAKRPQGNTIIRRTRPSFFIMTILASLHRCYEFLQWLGCFFGVLGSSWNEQKVRMDPNPEDAVEIHPSDNDHTDSHNDSHSQNDRNDSNGHNNNNIENRGSEIEDEDQRDIHTRKYLQSDVHTTRESGLEASQVPKHIAVIMDGNRRYGKAKYGSVTKGHWDGSRTLVDFSKWCLAEGVQIITVYAFSTENWNRSASEVSVLMNIFCKYCEELRVEALQRGIRIQVLSTETEQIPDDVAEGVRRMVEDTKHCNQLIMNICLSYGSKGEILNACKAIAKDVSEGVMDCAEITDSTFESKLLTGGCPDPDLIIRTSGEFRLSNFMLWQLAYSEMFFLDKQWPELTKGDLITVMKDYARNRQRRFGK